MPSPLWPGWRILDIIHPLDTWSPSSSLITGSLCINLLKLALPDRTDDLLLTFLGGQLSLIWLGDHLVEVEVVSVRVFVLLEDISVEPIDERERVESCGDEQALLVIGVGSVNEVFVVNPAQEILVNYINVLACLVTLDIGLQI